MKGGIITKPQILFGHETQDDFVIPIPKEGLPVFDKDKIMVIDSDISQINITKMKKAIKKYMRKRP